MTKRKLLINPSGTRLAKRFLKTRFVDATLLACLETVLFLVGHAVDLTFGLFWGAILFFGFNFLLVFRIILPVKQGVTMLSS